MMRTEETIYRFAEFELDAAKHSLFKNNETIALNAKAFALLLVLIQNRERVLSKDELLEKVWAGQFVEENNLTVQISALRKILGERKDAPRFFINVPGKGYKFIADVETSADKKELIIENHSFSRIFIEESEASENENDLFQQNQHLENHHALPSLRQQKNKWLTMMTALTAILLFGAIGFWFYFPAAQREADKTAASFVTLPPKTRTFTPSAGIPHRVAIAPDGKSIAYVQREKARDSIWFGDLETDQSIQITGALERLHDYLAFAPDGKSVYFTARDENHLVWTLMRVSIYGGAPLDLTASVDSAISFSPDGRQFAFLRKDVNTNQSSLIVADASTGRDERILLEPETGQKIVSSGVSWSPDGSLIAFGAASEPGRECEIAAVKIADGSIHKINSSVCRANSNLTWLRDGSGIILTTAGNDDNGNGQVWLVSYPSGEAQKITNDTLNYHNFSLSVSNDDRIAVLQGRSDPKIWLVEASETEDPRPILEGSRARSEGMYGLDFAPNGKIIYSARTGDSRAVWEMNADGTNQRQLTASQKDSDDSQISVSADNRFLIFQSTRSGKSEIWRANRDGSNLRQLTEGGGNTAPSVSSDGNWAAYTATRDGKSTLWRVSINGGEPVQITFEETSWAAISPDGKYVACAFGKAVGASKKRIAVYPSAGGAPLKVFETAIHSVLYNRFRWSPDGKAIVYKDDVQGLWRQDLDKEKPEEMKVFNNQRVFHFAFSPGGKLIYSGGVQMREIVILKNFR